MEQQRNEQNIESGRNDYMTAKGSVGQIRRENQEIHNERLTGERALFQGRNLKIYESTFADGESPLKEAAGIEISDSEFQWKYPLWYCRDVVVKGCKLLEMARAGIWYSSNIYIEDTMIEAPKIFRRCDGIRLINVSMPNASETLWHCKNVVIENAAAHGDYLGMNCSDVKITNLDLDGNYSFDGAKNVEIHSSKLMSRDAFWNTENVTVYDSYINGEYLGWNSKNLTLINCTIDSLQGLCYVENLVMKHCRLENTTLAFEYSTCDVEVIGKVDSILNPAGGVIRADSVDELIMEADKVNPSKTRIIVGKDTFEDRAI